MYYHRYCIHAVNGRRVEETVSIPLLVCSSCGASQAVLPDALIPFGSYSVRFVLTVLRAFAARHCTVADFCDQWQLSQSTVYDWRRRLDSQLSEWISAPSADCTPPATTVSQNAMTSTSSDGFTTMPWRACAAIRHWLLSTPVKLRSTGWRATV